MGVDRDTQRGAFREIGLTAVDEAVWRALLESPRLGMQDLSERCDQDQLAVKAALEHLCEVGLLRTSAASPLGVVPADPGPALETQLVTTERALAERAAALAQIRLLVPELAQQYLRLASCTAGHSALEFLDNLAATRAEIYRASARTESDIRTLDPGRGSTAAHVEAIEHSKTSQLGVLSRGVRDRSIIDARIFVDATVVALRREFRSHGALVRSLPNVPIRLTIFDLEQAVIALDPSDASRGAFVIRTPSIVEALAFMFDHMWSVASPVFDIPEDANLPGPRSARILELITLGMTDNRIGRALGVRPRTVGREIALLKEALGVNSRAEIVAAAAKRGWL